MSEFRAPDFLLPESNSERFCEIFFEILAHRGNRCCQKFVFDHAVVLLPPGRTFLKISFFSCRGVLRLFGFLASFGVFFFARFRLSVASEPCSADAAAVQSLVAGPTT